MGKLSDFLMGGDLFANVRVSDPDTSQDAAASHKALRRLDRISALLAHADHQSTGLTDYELADTIKRQQNSAGKRRGELRDLGFIEDSGERRRAPSGASAIVWRITDKGKLYAMGFKNN